MALFLVVLLRFVPAKTKKQANRACPLLLLERQGPVVLQHPLRREHFASQPLFQHCGLIEGLGQRFEDGFHDVVRVAAIHEVHVQVESTVGDEGLEEVFEQTKVEGFDLPIRQIHVIDEVGPTTEIDGDLRQRFIERS